MTAAPVFGGKSRAPVVDIRCTLTCDRCRRYLVGPRQTVVEFGEVAPLLAKAEEYGWLLEWEPGLEREEPVRSLCPHCAGKLERGSAG